MLPSLVSSPRLTVALNSQQPAEEIGLSLKSLRPEPEGVRLSPRFTTPIFRSSVNPKIVESFMQFAKLVCSGHYNPKSHTIPDGYLKYLVQHQHDEDPTQHLPVPPGINLPAVRQVQLLPFSSTDIPWGFRAYTPRGHRPDGWGSDRPSPSRHCQAVYAVPEEKGSCRQCPIHPQISPLQLGAGRISQGMQG